MSNNIIDKIQLSGVTYDIGGQGGSGVSVVEVTQAEYDALPTSAKTDTSKMYVITDAEAGDLTNYYTKTETNTLLGGKADTATTYTKTEVDNAITAATATKQDTLVSGTNIKTINNTSILGSGNIDIQGGGGGGKAVSAGTNISVTTGETADTINCTLPFEKVGSTNSYSISFGGYSNNTSGTYCFFVGQENQVKNYGTKHFIIGDNNDVGRNTSETNLYRTLTVGEHNINVGGVVFGRYNNPNDSNIFTIGNGNGSTTRKNAFEVRQNGDIYFTLNGQDVKLQDILTQLLGS